MSRCKVLSGHTFRENKGCVILFDEDGSCKWSFRFVKYHRPESAGVVYVVCNWYCTFKDANACRVDEWDCSRAKCKGIVLFVLVFGKFWDVKKSNLS